MDTSFSTNSPEFYFFLIFLVKSRDVFERAVEFYGEENMDEKLFVSFARFEEACKEVHLL